jgi:hypothetical protein
MALAPHAALPNTLPPPLHHFMLPLTQKLALRLALGRIRGNSHLNLVDHLPVFDDFAFYLIPNLTPKLGF